MLEIIVDHHIITRNPLHRKQHTYQSGKSIKIALHNLVGKIEDTLDETEIMLTAFLDIEVHLTPLCINQWCRLPYILGLSYFM